MRGGISLNVCLLNIPSLSNSFNHLARVLLLFFFDFKINGHWKFNAQDMINKPYRSFVLDVKII
jgi:hypothetical protein